MLQKLKVVTIMHICVYEIRQTLEEAREAACNGICYMMCANVTPKLPRMCPVSLTPQILTDPISEYNELIVDSGCSEHMFNIYL